MPLLHLYVAASVDGYIATPDGGIGWLAPFEEQDYGYDDFIAGIGTVVMGRRTFDQTRSFDVWPYAGKRTVVLTSRPLPSPPPGVAMWSGNVVPLIDSLREGDGGDVWLVGGALAVRPFLDYDAVDRLDLHIIPILLGDGIRLFDRSSHAARLRPRKTLSYRNGVVRVIYEKE